VITSERGRQYVWHQVKGACIVDEALQGDVPGDRVRVWVGTEQRPAVYVRSILNDKSVPFDGYLTKLTPAERNRKASELAAAIADYEDWLESRRRARCHGCGKSLNSIADATCKNCGWIKCTCGACGCDWWEYGTG
jgi:hypothetical protein